MKIAALFALAASMSLSTAMAADTANVKKVMSVDTVKLTILRDAPNWLQIDATGKVRTGGWKDGQLSPMMTMLPPADGLYAFNFVATAPIGTVPEMITPISVRPPHVWKSYPAKLKGVRVFSETNCVITLLPGVDPTSVTLGKCTISK